MFFHFISSEDFRPKRLVFQNPSGTPSAHPTRENPYGIPSPEPADAEQPVSAPPRRMTSEQRAEFDKREREYLEKTRREEYKLQGDIAEGVRDRLKERDAQEAITGFFEERHDAEYRPASWAKWNKEYAEKMGYEDPKEAQERIRAMQRVIFDQLGLHGDPSATVDGKIGPYTLAAMAVYTGKKEGVRIPNPERNRALAGQISPQIAETEDAQQGSEEARQNLEEARQNLEEARQKMEEAGETTQENFLAVQQAEEALAAIEAKIEAAERQSEPAAAAEAPAPASSESHDDKYNEAVQRWQWAKANLEAAQNALASVPIVSTDYDQYEKAVQEAQAEIDAAQVAIDNAYPGTSGISVNVS